VFADGTYLYTLSSDVCAITEFSETCSMLQPLKSHFLPLKFPILSFYCSLFYLFCLYAVKIYSVIFLRHHISILSSLMPYSQSILNFQFYYLFALFSISSNIFTMSYHDYQRLSFYNSLVIFSEVQNKIMIFEASNIYIYIYIYIYKILIHCINI